MTELHEEEGRANRPSWDLKARCTCGAEYVSRAELWKHQADELRKSAAFIVEVLQLVDEFEGYGMLCWRNRDNKISFDFNCNDLFYWATADSESIEKEDLPLLRQCITDLRAADKEYGDCYVSELFAARKRKMRPQYPFFRNYNKDTKSYNEDTLSPAVRELFDACGPDGSDRNRG